MNRRFTLFALAGVGVLLLALVVLGAVFVFSPFGRGGLSFEFHADSGQSEAGREVDSEDSHVDRDTELDGDTEVDGDTAEVPDDSLTVMLAGRDDRLTDSMMLLHIDGEDKTARILTIPRDLWYGGRKINEKYYRGGGTAMMDAVGELTGYQPDYFAVVDMDGFVEIIDHLGGIEVTLDEPLHDHTLLMPDRRSRVDYEAGTHEVSGAEALLIARSRATTDDFDRALRQTRIIEGLQERVSEVSFTDIPALYRIARTVYDYVDTDMSVARAVGYLLDYGIIDEFERSGLSTENVLENSHSAYLPDDEVAHRSGWPEDMEELVQRRDPEEVEADRRAFGGNKPARVLALSRRDREDVESAWEKVRQQYLPDDEAGDESQAGTDDEAGDETQAEVDDESQAGTDTDPETADQTQAESSAEAQSDNDSSLFDPPASAISFKRRAIEASGIYRTLPARGAWLLKPVDGEWEHIRWFSEQFFETGAPDHEQLRERIGREPGEVQ